MLMFAAGSLGCATVCFALVEVLIASVFIAFGLLYCADFGMLC